MNDPIETLQKRLEYRFNNPELIELALTHRSVSGRHNNERLEFLGDSILNFVIAQDLFQRFPEAKEGQLSRLRARLVQGKTLAVIARELQLGDGLKLGSGELKSGGYRRDSILADAFEAVIGAIYQDAGLEAAQERILYWYRERLQKLTLKDTGKDAKTRLQEFLQSKQWPLPEYKVLRVVGQAHNQRFTVHCTVVANKEHETQYTQGAGSSRRKAEQNAAAAMLEALGASHE